MNRYPKHNSHDMLSSSGESSFIDTFEYAVE